MVSCARMREKPNIITIAWAGTVNSDPPMCSISVRKERFSHGIIRDSGEFVINLCGQDQLRATDYCGVKSGRDEDKFAACGLTAVPVPGFAAPPSGNARCTWPAGCSPCRSWVAMICSWAWSKRWA